LAGCGRNIADQAQLGRHIFLIIRLGSKLIV